jgi:enoyl-[acyl-carrier protein] reductase II
MDNRIKKLFNIDFPLVQAGMIWCSGWELASAVSNAGGLGIIGSGSMYPDVLRLQIQKCKAATNKPFGVNIPLLYPNIDEHIQIMKEESMKIVFSSAGNPAKYTSLLKSYGMTVVHVVSNRKFALKAVEAGVDAIVAEGFEAGGHNGREETTTLCLIPDIVDAVSVPVIAAGGIASGKAMAAAFALGAEGVQIGSRFVASEEASAHQAFKNRVIQANEGDTLLSLKALTPVRLLKNEFFEKVKQAEGRGASTEELNQLLGRGRAKKGMFEGDMIEGELEIGQISASIRDILPAAQIVENIKKEFYQTIEKLAELKS